MLKSRYEQGESSKDSANKYPCVTTQVLLKKYRHQHEEERYWHWRDEEEYWYRQEENEYQHRCKEERYEREQVELHWQCLFFKYCLNEGLKL